MCGILSFYGKSFDQSFEHVFHTALDTLSHRGPDAFGVWLKASDGIALGHRRLSILDLTDAGKQPMHSQNHRWVISFNGEIYNFQDLKSELEEQGVVFRTRTDTEVLLEGISLWGIEETLKKTVGMFSFAVWDQEERKLFVARDRFGEKPCYLARTSKGWLIASELKAITAFPFFEEDIDPFSVQLFLNYKYIPEPKSIYKNVKKLQPGCYACITKDGSLTEIPYWSFLDCVERGQANIEHLSEEEAIDHLDWLLRRTIKEQKVSDVPVGAFLSGGIDSSLIVSIMQQIEGKPVHTFSIGFEDKDYDESIHARKVAAHLQTNHTELIVTPNETLSVIPELGGIYDEPYADSSAIPTILVSRLARKSVTVSLSGDAGDEIFGGYTRYRHVKAQWEKMNNFPSFIRLCAKWGFDLGKQIASGMNNAVFFHKFLLRQRYASVQSFADAYHGHMTHFQVLEDYLNLSKQKEEELGIPTTLDLYHFAMATDTMQYLPSDILTKVDRAAMVTSLETRVPLLDHRIVEWAWSLPSKLKIDQQSGKKILRKLLFRYVPSEILERPKQGFGIPVGRWIRKELRDWADEMMNEQSLQKTNVFDQKKMAGLWRSHRDGLIDDTYNIWAVLILQAWLLDHNLSL